MPASFDIATIATQLGNEARRFDIDVVAECDSTNTLLQSRAERGAPSGSVLIAQAQTSGRGRRGRVWISAPGDSLTFSLFWRFAPRTSPAGLSLAVGLAVARAIEKVGVTEGNPLFGTGETALETTLRPPVQLKWPNDILIDGRKLGGILIELLPGAPHAAVIGIGINRRLPPDLPDEIRATAAALPVATESDLLLAALLHELLHTLGQFATSGFAGLRAEWLTYHAFQNHPIRLLSDFAPACDGICRGVDVDGALLFEFDGRIERVLSGEVSLRSAT
jgi:BirA family biotin operon repressor/biotin-[acetyl-CoA-carboxylase] ligase